MSNTAITEKYRPENDPEMMRYWMKEGPKTAAFLLVIPGFTVMGAGAGLLAANIVPYSVIGLGFGLVAWGLIVVIKK